MLGWDTFITTTSIKFISQIVIKRRCGVSKGNIKCFSCMFNNMKDMFTVIKLDTNIVFFTRPVETNMSSKLIYRTHNQLLLVEENWYAFHAPRKKDNQQFCSVLGADVLHIAIKYLKLVLNGYLNSCSSISKMYNLLKKRSRA